MPVGPGGYQVQRDPRRVGQGGALEPLLAAVYGRAPRLLSTAGGLSDSAIDRQDVEIEADHAVILRDHEHVQPLREAGFRPGMDPAPDRPIRAGGTCDPHVARPVGQRQDDVLGDDAVGDAASVAAERVGRGDDRPFGQQGGELFPDGGEQRSWYGRLGTHQRDSRSAPLSSPDLCLPAYDRPIAGRS